MAEESEYSKMPARWLERTEEVPARPCQHRLIRRLCRRSDSALRQEPRALPSARAPESGRLANRWTQLASQ
jgi:hypothetical protein